MFSFECLKHKDLIFLLLAEAIRKKSVFLNKKKCNKLELIKIL